ncbi:MAG: polysaccharide pyruvyl transferase family protein [Clostridia bacterium]|nr:polysaccharide pyruvyl transferase family protein [Clostridia bacterium]
MKKIATITFHSSYNYGSNLQAYALQEFIKKLCNNDCEYRIINLRLGIQKEVYTDCFERDDWKSKIKRVFYYKQKKDIIGKRKKFEDFINNKLCVTEEYNTLEELKKEKWNYDYYISGSDQLWNIKATDFDWAYFLEFINKGKKISYAASIGSTNREWDEEETKRVKENLKKYDAISVREEGTANKIKGITGISPKINVDPTLLLTEEDWNLIVPEKPIITEEYILLYNLRHGRKEILNLASKISKILKLPIVTTLPSSKEELLYGFKRKYDVGPLEFLNILKNAKFVLSSSFHGTLFSILFQKPFFVLGAAKDYRIENLLEKTKLSNRHIDIENIYEKCKEAYDIDFGCVEECLNIERKKSEDYLKRALELE